MPLYEYECPSCGEKFELLVGIHDNQKELRCPKCQAPGPRKLMSGFSSCGVRATGSGGSSTGST